MIEKVGAGEGNRTLVISLEGFCSTIELHPRCAERIIGRRGPAHNNIPASGKSRQRD
jgi:hypothetical protein